MKEILFRGKRVDNGEWVEGYYGACDEYGDNGGVEHMYRDTCTRLHYIIHTSGAPSHLVYPDTVSQWTGLEDVECTNRKVFDGDIVAMHQFLFNGVEYDYETLGIVEYNNEVASWGLTKLNNEEIAKEMGYNNVDDAETEFHPFCNFYGLHETSFMVVGNKWDNPELMDG